MGGGRGAFGGCLRGGGFRGRTWICVSAGCGCEGELGDALLALLRPLHGALTFNYRGENKTELTRTKETDEGLRSQNRERKPLKRRYCFRSD